MTDAITVFTAVAALATVGLAFATWNAALATTRTARETMKADLFERYCSRWTSPMMRQARAQLASAILDRLDAPDKTIPVTIVDPLGVFVEELGLLLAKDHLDKDFVWDGFSPYLQVYWEHAVKHTVAAEMKKPPKVRHETYYWKYKELVQSMDGLSKQRGENFSLPPAELRELLIAERDQPTGRW